MRSFWVLLALIFSTIAPAKTVENTPASDELLELSWLDLIPESERNNFNNLSMPPLEHSGDAALQLKLGGVRQELNGSRVKIPGFVIPLEGNADKVSEFLLVPFLGACIHVPPPPPNQIIFVKFKDGAPVQDLWDVVYITGTIKTEPTMTDELGAESGYVIDGVSLEAYSQV
ncbi:DUF3299 domain-containing protein [Vibrio sp. JC009]|uniref:DUF3299 domain-containing protein n=1 Tax=Vibrio sp. JC009 TaxID=2912314 RepID=UPI0023B13824|nr:DUF3299 domain-containing protein [Vibrio sp. JC009]WED24440.1 DUF3299 domain-containing protein [Vibrio sp. JC009]